MYRFCLFSALGQQGHNVKLLYHNIRGCSMRKGHNVKHFAEFPQMALIRLCFG